jgi:ABC-type protease/lipase transport system fused ATPase/permease subunit
MYEQQKDQMSNQQFNLDQTAFAIDTVKSTQVTVAAMSAAAKTLKKEQKKIDLNDLENMQDDMEGTSLHSLKQLNFVVLIISSFFHFRSSGRRG